MKISILIPTFNNQNTIDTLINYLIKNDPDNHVYEIVVIDGGSTDSTRVKAREAGARVLRSPRKGTEAQLNHGAAMAVSDILYILHPQTIPPASYAEDIFTAVNNRYQSGTFQVDFESDHWFLNIKRWITYLDENTINLEDQSLFVTKEALLHAGGFSEDQLVLKNVEVLRRIKLYARFRVFDRKVKSSAHKYLQKGIVRLHGGFFLMYLLYRIGISNVQVQKLYRYIAGSHKD
jgi:glycosyltransferase involved in cell wall biosynthesis